MTTDQSLADELLPCPFCGGADVNLHEHKQAAMWWVSCKSCGLEAPSETGTTRIDAITYWNTRAAARLDAQMEEALERISKIHLGDNLDTITTARNRLNAAIEIARSALTPQTRQK